MTEILGLQQKELPYYKRWFRHPETQLFVWELNKQMIQFMFLFDYQNSEYVFSWDARKIQNVEQFSLCLCDVLKEPEISDLACVPVRRVLNEIPFQPSLKASQMIGCEEKIIASILKNKLLSYGDRLPPDIKHYIFCALWYTAC